MNTEIIELLENINVLYNRKNNINELLNLINEKELPKNEPVEIIVQPVEIPKPKPAEIIPKPIVIRVLSYNVSHLAMSGKTNTKVTKGCPKIDENTECLHNVAEFIKTKNKITPFDFIGLQEATNYEAIIRLAEITNMKYVHNNPGNEDMITLYDNKHTLEESVSFRANSDSRPISILFFKGKICVINIHFDDEKDFNKLGDYLNDFLFTNRTNININKDAIKNKLETYNIIMMGDMHNNFGGRKTITLPTKFIPLEKKLHGINKIATCCSNILKPTIKKGSVDLAYDHILSTSSNIITKVHDVLGKLTSVHLPITAIITL